MSADTISTAPSASSGRAVAMPPGVSSGSGSIDQCSVHAERATVAERVDQLAPPDATR